MALERPQGFPSIRPRLVWNCVVLFIIRIRLTESVGTVTAARACTRADTGRPVAGPTCNVFSTI